MANVFKNITAAVLAAASIGAMSITASAETPEKTPVNWTAVYFQGAPTNVNKTYYYTIFTYGDGYDITCTSFYGDYNRNVEVREQYDTIIPGPLGSVDKKVADLHSTTNSPIHIAQPGNLNGETITFSFKASGDPSCEAHGIIDQHK